MHLNWKGAALALFINTMCRLDLRGHFYSKKKIMRFDKKIVTIGGARTQAHSIRSSYSTSRPQMTAGSFEQLAETCVPSAVGEPILASLCVTGRSPHVCLVVTIIYGAASLVPG